MPVVLEPFFGSFLILLFGFITIPIVGYVSGAYINMFSAMKMSFIFFLGRFALLYLLRKYFEKNRYA